MRKAIVHIMVTTGITLVVLALIGTAAGADWLAIGSVFQSFGANIIIHAGLVFLRRIEIRYMLLERMIDLVFVILVLIIFGSIFNWYNSTPVWILILMALFIYTVSVSVNIFRARRDLAVINDLLRTRKEKDFGGNYKS